MDAIQVEVANLKVVRDQVTAQAEARIAALQQQADRLEPLEARVTELKAENEEKSSKISELEIEILELKEEQEIAEDQRSQTAERIKSLEEDVKKAEESGRQALEGADAKAADDLAKATEESAKLQAEIGELKEHLESLTVRCTELEGQLAEAVATHEATKAEIASQSEMHAAEFESLQASFRERESKLQEELKTVSADLEVRCLLDDRDDDLSRPHHRARNPSTTPKWRTSRRNMPSSWRKPSNVRR